MSAPTDAELFERAVRDGPKPPRTSPAPRPLSAAQVLNRLRSGAWAPAEVTVRLMTRPQARAQLLAFLRACRRDGRRGVKVIHGKGREGTGTLRRVVPQWLAEWRPELVQRWESVRRERDGGAGALWVVLQPPGRP